MNIEDDKLFELYKLAIESDRFELDLAWKLVQFFTVLNSGLLSLGFTLLGSNQLSPKYYVAPIFVIGIVLQYPIMHTILSVMYIKIIIT